MPERAFRYRFYPTPEQEQLLRRTLGCVRLVYNKALAVRTEAWYSHQERIDYCQTSAMLTAWKKEEELSFLKDVSSVPLQQALRHLQKAFTNFWDKRAKYPRFKKKRNGGSATFAKVGFQYKDGQVFLAKCSEPLNIKWTRQLPASSELTTITVKLDASGRWFASILVNDETIDPLPKIEKALGIDVGITSLITTSDGQKVSNPKHFKRLYKKLRRVQKAYSRTQKGSKNREKARIKVARVHAKISDSRKDFLHKLTTQLVRENQTIVVEDLAVRNLVKNHKLAQAISDCSWSEFVLQLDYKCQWYGRELIKIDRFFPSSKRCGNCGHVMDKLPLNIREWTCPKCGTTHDRDINAAKNILAAGHAVSVCGANIRPDKKNLEGQLRKTRKRKKQKPES